MQAIKASELELWAREYKAAAELPRLIRQLIWASVHDVSRLEMPSDEHVRLAGFDGIVSCKSGTNNVPAGDSVWEFSTESDVKGKADDDYDKRKNAPDSMS